MAKYLFMIASHNLGSMPSQTGSSTNHLVTVSMSFVMCQQFNICCSNLNISTLIGSRIFPFPLQSFVRHKCFQSKTYARKYSCAFYSATPTCRGNACTKFCLYPLNRYAISLGVRATIVAYSLLFPEESYSFIFNEDTVYHFTFAVFDIIVCLFAALSNT